MNANQASALNEASIYNQSRSSSDESVYTDYEPEPPKEVLKPLSDKE